MFRNMVTALFRHERIVTTKAKGKELKRISERLITRAKRNADLPTDDTAARLHNKRELSLVVKPGRSVVRGQIRVPFGPGDKPFRNAFQLLALRFRCHNPFMSKERGDHIAEHRFAMGMRSPKLPYAVLMPHLKPL